MRCTLPTVIALSSLFVANPIVGQEATKSFVYAKTKQADLEMVVHFPARLDGIRQASRDRVLLRWRLGDGTIKAFEAQAKYFAGRGMVAARADYRVKSRHGVTPKDC